jgi:hypothetical protein
MNLRRLAWVAGVATAALAFAAVAQPAPGCFFVRDIGDRTVGGPHTLYFKVKDQAHMHAIAYFHVETQHNCDTSASDTQHGGFRIGSTRVNVRRAEMICKPEDVKIDTGVRCPIATIERMTQQEVAALPRLIRP